MIDELHQGSWKGWISFEKSTDKPAVWDGQYELQNAVLDVPGLASPVRIASATVQMNGADFQVTRLHGRAGTVNFDGEYRYQAAAAHPYHLRVTILRVADRRSPAPDAALAAPLRRFSCAGVPP